jgi:hypothetical protein
MIARCRGCDPESRIWYTDRTDLFRSVDAQYRTEAVFLLNAGLDAAYIMPGFFLME